MLVLTIGGKDLRFEHSLVSLSEWEGFYEKPFFSVREDQTKTTEEFLKYFEFMLSPLDFKHRKLLKDSKGEPSFTADQLTELVEYINADRTATVVREIQNKPGPKENVTSELIYYWLVAFKIDFWPTDTWHLNRLLMLVRVCGVKNAPATKKSRGQMVQDYRKLNEERRKKLGTTG